MVGSSDVDQPLSIGDQHRGDLLRRTQRRPISDGAAVECSLYAWSNCRLCGTRIPRGWQPFVGTWTLRLAAKKLEFLGPFLILVGMILLGLIEIPTSSGNWMNGLRVHVEKMGLAGSALLGLLFALSFCPVSAALFFGSLIPLAITNESKLLLPAIYGIGTGIPVIVFAVMLVFGQNSLGQFFSRVTGAEKWLRTITGVSILLVGVYITLQQIYNVSFQ